MKYGQTFLCTYLDKSRCMHYQKDFVSKSLCIKKTLYQKNIVYALHVRLYTVFFGLWCTSTARAANEVLSLAHSLSRLLPRARSFFLLLNLCVAPFLSIFPRRCSKRGTILTHCTTLQHTRDLHSRRETTPRYWRQARYYNILKHTATHCNTLQHTWTHCNTLEHTGILSKEPLINIGASPGGALIEPDAHSSIPSRPRGQPSVGLRSLGKKFTHIWRLCVVCVLCVCCVCVRVCAQVCVCVRETAGLCIFYIMNYTHKGPYDMKCESKSFAGLGSLGEKFARVWHMRVVLCVLYHDFFL